MVRRVKATRDRAYQSWTAGLGWFTYPSQTNFIFTEPRDGPGRTGPAVARRPYDFLLPAVLVRHFPATP